MVELVQGLAGDLRRNDLQVQVKFVVFLALPDDSYAKHYAQTSGERPGTERRPHASKIRSWTKLSRLKGKMRPFEVIAVLIDSFQLEICGHLTGWSFRYALNWRPPMTKAKPRLDFLCVCQNDPVTCIMIV
jgi:hypothetical protein